MEAPSYHPSGKLQHWLQRLQVAKETVSQGRGLRAVTSCMLRGAAAPLYGANLTLLPTTGDCRLPGGLSHPSPLPSAERPAVCSPSGAMHLVPAGGMARHGVTWNGARQPQRMSRGLGRVIFTASLDCNFLFKHFSYLCELREQFFFIVG